MQVPASFKYARATTVDEAIALLNEGESTRLIAGGHSLLPMMKLRLASFDTLVDINDLHDALGYVRREGAEMRIGALTRHRELLESDELHFHFPIFRDAEHVIADPVVRNRGTIGGSLCQADPSEDLSAVCTTLNASCVIRGASGERVVAMEDFYRGPYETAVGDGEILTEIRVPIRSGGSSAFKKVERRAGDWAVTSCGAAVWMSQGIITDARVGLAAVGPNTTGIPSISALLTGEAPTEELFAQAGALAAEAARPAPDLRGTVEYKRHLADELTRRALRTSVERINERGA